MYCTHDGCWQLANCSAHAAPATKDPVVENGSGMLQDSVIKVDSLRGRFHVLGLKLAKTRYLSVGLGTSNSLTVGLVPFDVKKASKVELGPEPGFLSVARLILRMARSAHLFSSEMELAGFQLVRIAVSVSGIGFAIPAANAKIKLRPSGKAPAAAPSRDLFSRVINSPLETLRNLSHQALALADNFKAVGFELGTLGAEGGWLTLTVGTTFGISVSLLPIQQLTPLTHGQTQEPVRPLPVKHLTAFQSMLLSLLLRANQTVCFLLGGRAEVGMITLKVDHLGAGIPQVVATVSCVSPTKALPASVEGKADLATTAGQGPASSDPPGVDVLATSEEIHQLQTQLSAKLTEEGVAPPVGPPPVELQKGEVFIQEMEERHAQSPVSEEVGGHGPEIEPPPQPARKEEGPQHQEIPAAEQPAALDLDHPPAVAAPEEAGGVGSAILGAGKQVGSKITGAAKAVVGGLGKSLGAVQGLLHRNNQEENVKGVVTMGETVGTQVRSHGYRLAYPDWLEVTVGTVVGCNLCVEPIPNAEQRSVVEQKGDPPSGQAAALLQMFVKAVKSVENAAVTLQQNHATIHSFDLMVDNVGLGIPKVGVAINLNRK